MSGRHCALIGCGNGDYRLNRWRQTFREKHGKQTFTCHAPFQLLVFTFSLAGTNRLKLKKE